MDGFWCKIGIHNDARPWNKRHISDYYGERCSWMDHEIKPKYCPHVKGDDNWVNVQADRDFVLRNIGAIVERDTTYKSITSLSYDKGDIRNQILPKEPRAYPGHQPEFDTFLAKVARSDRRSVTHRDYSFPDFQYYPSIEAEREEDVYADLDVQRAVEKPEEDKGHLHEAGFRYSQKDASVQCSESKSPEDASPPKDGGLQTISVTSSDFTHPSAKLQGIAETTVREEATRSQLDALPLALRRYHKNVFNVQWIDKDGRVIGGQEETYSRTPFARTLRSNFLSTTSADFNDPKILNGPFGVLSELYKTNETCSA